MLEKISCCNVSQAVSDPAVWDVGCRVRPLSTISDQGQENVDVKKHFWYVLLLAAEGTKNGKHKAEV